ncbi:MAG: hypothetical protein ABR613_10360 [Actinomycetota bacterium]
MRRAPIVVAALTAVTLPGCSGGPEDGLEGHLREVAAVHDEHYGEHGKYPRPSDLGEQIEREGERWNLVIYYGRPYGYCLEGDDEKGTWHLQRDSDELEEGECPRSGGPIME